MGSGRRAFTLDQKSTIGVHQSSISPLATLLQYGAGLRLSELVRMRVQDVDPSSLCYAGASPSSLRYAVASKDRVTVLPRSLREEIARQIESAREMWQNDREAGLAGVYIPGALARKFRRAAETFEWFWLFPAKQTSVDPESGIRRRHHLHGQVYNEAIKRAAWDCGDISPLSHWPTCRPV